MDEPVELDVLAVGAHPDDCEIGCGGTLATLARQGLRVGIVDLTDGEPTPRCPDPAIRLREARNAAEVMGLSYRKILSLPNRILFDNFDARLELAKQLRLTRPKVVIGIGAKTPMASPDHWQAMQITDAAIFYSRLSKWDQYFGDLPVHVVSRQLYYSFFFESDWSGAGPQQFVYDISDSLETKIQAIQCYETQFPDHKSYIFDRVNSMAIACGQSAGFAAGEPLTSTRTLGSQDLFQTLQLSG